MSRCNRCKLDIEDDTMICPLCNGVLERNTDLADTPADEYISQSVMYPDVTPAMRKMKFVVKLVIFLSVLLEIILAYINYITYDGVKWSIVCGAGFVYICVTMIYTILYNKGHRRSIMFQAIGLMFLAVIIDYVLGYKGWSMEFAIPSTILAVNLAILVMMLVNIRNFQMYLMMEIYTTIISTIFLIVVMCIKLVDFKILAVIATGVSWLLLIGSIVFGDRKAISELTRRFRV